MLRLTERDEATGSLYADVLRLSTHERACYRSSPMRLPSQDPAEIRSLAKGYTGRVLVEDFVGLSASNVAPGGIYQTTCYPKTAMLISELLVRGFTLLELYIDNYFVKTREDTSNGGSRTYCLERADSRPARLHVRVVLKNETDQELPAREANFEETC